jgi:hypothetical protein
MKNSQFKRILRLLAFLAFPSLATITAPSIYAAPPTTQKALSSQARMQLAVQLGAIKLGYSNAKGLNAKQLARALALGEEALNLPANKNNTALLIQAAKAALQFPITNNSLGLNPSLIPASAIVAVAAAQMPTFSAQEITDLLQKGEYSPLYAAIQNTGSNANNPNSGNGSGSGGGYGGLAGGIGSFVSGNGGGGAVGTPVTNIQGQ